MEDSSVLLQKILGVIHKHKAEDVEVLDVRRLAGYTDYLVICSGQSDRQVRAIAEHIVEDMKKERILPYGQEGTREGEWVLLDYNDVVVHVFHEPVRAFYDLEGLWRDAPRVPQPAPTVAVAAAS
jgi:ribosome-associated protein